MREVDDFLKSSMLQYPLLEQFSNLNTRPPLQGMIQRLIFKVGLLCKQIDMIFLAGKLVQAPILFTGALLERLIMSEQSLILS